jgi:hypothetical protein
MHCDRTSGVIPEHWPSRARISIRVPPSAVTAVGNPIDRQAVRYQSGVHGKVRPDVPPQLHQRRDGCATFGRSTRLRGIDAYRQYGVHLHRWSRGHDGVRDQRAAQRSEGHYPRRGDRVGAVTERRRLLPRVAPRCEPEAARCPSHLRKTSTPRRDLLRDRSTAHRPTDDCWPAR